MDDADDHVAKYKQGKWTWNSLTDRLQFHTFPEQSRERYIMTMGHKFLRRLNDEEEVAFRHEYVRSSSSIDTNTVMISDMRDLALFLMPSEFLDPTFLEFMHTVTVYKLLHSLIIYFDFYLRLVEFLLIRRDEISSTNAQIQDERTNSTKRTFSNHLSQYRLLVARNYSTILKAEGEMSKYYHVTKAHISKTTKDKNLYERFLAVTTQIIWISLHRRALHVIEQEMLRLFGAEHFIPPRPEYLKFSHMERCVLYGRNYRVKNFRYQVSALIQELRDIRTEELPLLWIGERKYRGTDLRIMQLELEYVVPGPYLYMIDISRGILGHPKKFYNSFLELNWTVVRQENYSELYDPFYIMRQPELKIPKFHESKIREMAKLYEHIFQVTRVFEKTTKKKLNNWLCRDLYLQAYEVDVRKHVTARAQLEIDSKGTGSEIYTNYSKVLAKLRQSRAKAAIESSKPSSSYSMVVANKTMSTKNTRKL